MANTLQSAFAPSGQLRASINLGNPILANRDASGPFGVSIDLANELARRLGVGVELVVFDGAAKSVDAVKNERADVGFFAIDPLRSDGLRFTAPYVLIEGSYLVRHNSALQDNDQVDRVGTRVAVGQGSAYDLFLTRELKHADIIRANGAQGAFDAFHGQGLDVVAGIRQLLAAEIEADARLVASIGLRLLPGRFMVIQQAMGCPSGRGEAAAAFLRQFVQEMKTTGFLADALKRHGIQGASVAPLEPAPSTQ